MPSSTLRKNSAGILLFRHQPDLQIFLVHPGGPFWAKKNMGVWSIPKGEFSPGEDQLQTAKREFFEETGAIISGDFVPLSPVKIQSGKVIYAWSVEGNLDPTQLKSNTFVLFGKSYPEVDRGEWFSLSIAQVKIHPAQAKFLTELSSLLTRI
ncbi:hypothetical protein A2634_01810 [Candidatus Amesbacteria bacterium RIFCSPHIGHO2_01_FULL_48_32]|uniref:Nudix hydrolase domain-containing protein n=1 Tax=Candidatus Amesbacteria bacterium RIFCSPLOWO2_01_FULL_48_25 TaxID=1797259 RepID=A0A1F4ZB12_9BACT|nr:MAG: hypothetical protein A2634_01810 [Candidatus Amesbacteria bacterium RIFCSPHIGHO2_01_FULL_48_32]OGD03395.1 MAG: hypothetical protein A2989_01010 [Candidatus Amesbacteria bacterium RIFCSPLOWO2_01_FULL_48_25]HJZ05012.1 NUDIX domain-containing protein [Patescibacteria group bacterium]